MGSMSAISMSEYGTQSLGWHILTNHYPPLPTEYVDLARQAIDLYNEGWDLDTRVEVPQDIEVYPRDIILEDDKFWVTIGKLIEILHLDPWLAE